LDNAPGIADRETAEKELVQQAEDGGVGADAQSEGEDGYDAESRAFPECSACVMEVLEECAHEL
jgi:hypothetical protein